MLFRRDKHIFRLVLFAYFQILQVFRHTLLTICICFNKVMSHSCCVCWYIQTRYLNTLFVCYIIFLFYKIKFMGAKFYVQHLH